MSNALALIALVLLFLGGGMLGHSLNKPHEGWALAAVGCWILAFACLFGAAHWRPLGVTSLQELHFALKKLYEPEK